MLRKKVVPALPAAGTALLMALACNLSSGIAPAPAATNPGQAVPQQVPTTALAATPGSTAQSTATSTTTPSVTHVVSPANSVGTGGLIYDVESQDTAPEKRAPYGDSYDINRLERPFLQDMTYVPDLDIASFTVSSDADWWYVSTGLIGNDPNNKLGIDYGVELDIDHDGFGNYLIWAHPPYTSTWDTAAVQIFEDNNHDTGGRSAEKSDAPITTDGYETMIFNGGVGDADADMAWVRINAGNQATVQFAFKKSWSGTVFMLGVIADAGLKDPKKLDYVDRFTIAEAGSPVRDNKNYPLKALFAVDNVCRAPFGFKPTGYEPQLCPSTAPPATKKPKPTAVPPPPGIMVPPP
jgi:hypothetical protein